MSLTFFGWYKNLSVTHLQSYLNSSSLNFREYIKCSLKSAHSKTADHSCCLATPFYYKKCNIVVQWFGEVLVRSKNLHEKNINDHSL